MFRNSKVPFENIMGHWNYLFWSLWRISVILASKIALKGVSSLINHTLFPCKLYYFSKFHQKHMNVHFLNVKSLIRLSQDIPIDVLWLYHPYRPIESILRIQNFEILMIFCHSPTDTVTNKKIIWSGVYQNYSEVSSNMSAISRIFFEGLGVLGGWEIGFLLKVSSKWMNTSKYPPPCLVIGPISGVSLTRGDYDL